MRTDPWHQPRAEAGGPEQFLIYCTNIPWIKDPGARRKDQVRSTYIPSEYLGA